VHDALSRLGYTVHVMADARRALEFAAAYRGTLHAVVTDVVLPDMNGRAVAAGVRNTHPEARILFVSGYTEHAIVQEGVLEPGTWFLQKPFTPEALGLKLREILAS
jgi:DNA-binding response OmpR family regulator